AVVDQHVVAAAVHREDRARPRVLVLGALLRARPAAAPVRPDAYLVLGVAQVPRHYRGLLAAPASPEPGAAAPTTGTRPSVIGPRPRACRTTSARSRGASWTSWRRRRPRRRAPRARRRRRTSPSGGRGRSRRRHRAGRRRGSAARPGAPRRRRRAGGSR